jgi:hypothetical protein
MPTSVFSPRRTRSQTERDKELLISQEERDNEEHAFMDEIFHEDNSLPYEKTRSDDRWVQSLLGTHFRDLHFEMEVRDSTNVNNDYVICDVRVQSYLGMPLSTSNYARKNLYIAYYNVDSPDEIETSEAYLFSPGCPGSWVQLTHKNGINFETASLPQLRSQIFNPQDKNYIRGFNEDTLYTY